MAELLRLDQSGSLAAEILRLGFLFSLRSQDASGAMFTRQHTQCKEN